MMEILKTLYCLKNAAEISFRSIDISQILTNNSIASQLF